jgi:hypothetical protein
MVVIPPSAKLVARCSRLSSVITWNLRLTYVKRAFTHTQCIRRDSIPRDANVAYCDAVIIV